MTVSQALIQHNEIAKVQRASRLEVRKTLTQFKAVAIKRALNGQSSILTQKEIARMTRAVATTMTAANRLGVRRVQILAKRVPIKAGLLEDALDDEEFPYFNGQAIRIVTDYAQSINDALQFFTQNLVGQGLPTSGMIKLLGDEFARLGVDPKNSYSLENITRTQAQLSYNAGKYEEEQKDYIQDILWGYTYSTVGDVRVREVHAQLEGVTLPKEDPFWQAWYPPNGWSCRCAVIPLFEAEAIKRPPKGIVVDKGFSGTPKQLLGIR